MRQALWAGAGSFVAGTATAADGAVDGARRAAVDGAVLTAERRARVQDFCTGCMGVGPDTVWGPALNHCTPIAKLRYH